MKILRFFAAVSLSFNLLASARAEVQVIHAFEFGPQNSQGRLLQASDSNFYGTSVSGGDGATVGGGGSGCIFRATPSGAITNVASFFGTNGANPYGTLVQGIDGKLYGTTQTGGAHNAGTVFSYTLGGALTTVCSLDVTNGTAPQTGLAFGPDGALYGTATGGGANNYGTIFRVTTNGTLTNLFSFGATNPMPATVLCLGSDNKFYGATAYGPANGTSYFTYGTLFSLTTNGVFTQLVGLTNTIGFHPANTFISGSDGAIYGTLQSGGPDNAGAAFRLTTDGNFSILANFTYGSTGGGCAGGLTYSSGTNFFGTTVSGTASGYGAFFRLAVNPNNYSNSVITVIDTFNGTGNGSSPVGGVTLANDGKFYGVSASGGSTGGGALFSVATNGPITTLSSLVMSQGSGSVAPLIIGPDGAFYGTTFFGGATDGGTIYRITTNGNYTLLASLGGNAGKNPYAPLCIGPDGLLYGATFNGGGGNAGTLFRISIAGNLQTLVTFISPQNGGDPYGGLVVGPDGFLYGTTEYGGSNGFGTVFRLVSVGTNFFVTNIVTFNNTNGANPQGTLLNGGDGFIYGTTFAGGTNNDGTIFRFNTGGAFNTVATFNLTNGYQPIGGLVRGADGAFYGGGYGNFSASRRIYRVTTNGVLTSLFAFPGNYGSEQYGSLVAGADGFLYDALYDGGTTGAGLLFRVDTNGVAGILSTLTVATGIHPFATPVFGADGNLYGTTYNYGPGGGGTVYRFVFDRITSISRNGSNAAITATGTSSETFALFATTNLVNAKWTNLSSTIATNSLVHFIDTNAAKFPQRFYRTAAQ